MIEELQSVDPDSLTDTELTELVLQVRQVQETAEALDVSPATVKREWTMARAWLNRELRG